MSDEEEVMSEEEVSEEEHSEAESEEEREQEKGPSEAQLAMQKRRAQQSSLGANLDEAAQEILETSRIEREKLEDEIAEMRSRNEKRKAEREEEDRRMAAKRAEEEAQRKAMEEEKKQKKEAEEQKRRDMRAARLAAYEALSLPQGRNFVITKKEGGEDEDEDEGEEEEERERKEKKSKEQQEQEKRAILSQRIKAVNMDELNSADKLKEKAKELHSQIVRLESEKYDLEKRFKAQQYDMMELAERARQMNKVGKGGLKRVQLKEDEVDKIQEKYAGAPAKVEMYSVYERQKDKRNYDDRHEVFHGPTWKYPAKKITPQKIVKWDEDTGLPIYEELAGGAPQEQAAEEE